MASQYFGVFALYLFLTVYLTISEVKTTQQLSKNEIEDPLEYKLTKLLDVHIGRNSNDNLQSSLRDNIRSEVRSVLEELRNDLVGTQNYNRPPGSKNGELIGENNFQELSKLLKELHSEISSMKNNVSKVFSTHFDDIQNFINKSPVGVSFDNEIYSSTSSKQLYPTNLWKDSSYTPKSCTEIQLKGYNISGVYKIQPAKSEKPFMVLCDMETQGGGWTHIQKRYDGSQDFYLNWREYKFGFGDLEREFWLGLENIFSITSSEKNELLVELVDRDNSKAYAHYKSFEIDSEVNGYKLTASSGFSGTAGDSMVYHVGSKFTTKDFDQDESSENCAEKYRGAWWYKNCHNSNLNGKYRNAELPKKYEYSGMQWYYLKAGYSYSESRMLVRRAHQ